MTKIPTTSKLSPATEYWLNRILRDHAQQIFFLCLAFLLIVLSSVIYEFYRESKYSSSGIKSSIINVINRSSTTIDSSLKSDEQSKIMQNGEIISTSSGKTVILDNGKIEIIRK